MLEFRRCVHRALTYKDSIIEAEKEIPDHRKLAIEVKKVKLVETSESLEKWLWVLRHGRIDLKECI